MKISAGVLCLVLASTVSGQSSSEPYSDCRSKTSNCGRANFDYLISSTGAIVFDFFMLTFEVPDRRNTKGAVFSSIASSRANRSSDGEVAPSDWRNAFKMDDQRVTESPAETRPRSSSRDDLERTNTLALFAWDWMRSLRHVQEGEFADDVPKPDVVTAKPDVRRDERPRFERGNDNAEHKNDGKGETRETPRKPDVRKGLEGDLTPEPSTLLLIGSTLPFAVAFIRGRRRRR